MDEPHERLKYAREKLVKGYKTATDAAKVLHPDAVSTYLGHENGSRRFTREDAERYAKFFHVRIEWLWLNKGAPHSESSSVDDRLAALPREVRQNIMDQIEFYEARESMKRGIG